MVLSSRKGHDSVLYTCVNIQHTSSDVDQPNLTQVSLMAREVVYVIKCRFVLPYKFARGQARYRLTAGMVHQI